MTWKRAAIASWMIAAVIFWQCLCWGDKLNEAERIRDIAVQMALSEGARAYIVTGDAEHWMYLQDNLMRLCADE